MRRAIVARAFVVSFLFWPRLAVGQSDDRHPDQALIDASSRGDLAAVQELLKKGANIDAVDEDGNTPLMKAAASGNHDVVKLILELGARCNAENHGGGTALMNAATGQVAELLLEKGASVEAKDDQGDNPLLWAALRGRSDVVKVLLDNRADIETGHHC